MSDLHEAARALLEALDDPRMPSLYEHKRNLRAALETLAAAEKGKG